MAEASLALDRFRTRLAQGISKPENGCWKWSGLTNSKGFAVMSRSMAGEVDNTIHTLSYIHHVGDVPDGMEVKQTCKCKLCWRPDHLALRSIGRTPQRMNVHESQNRATKQEREIAKRMGGQVTARSGAGKFEKADVRVKGILLVEAKTTMRKSFSVTTELLDKIEAQALQLGEVPIMEIEIDNAGKPRRVAIMPTWTLDMLLQRGAE